MKVLVTGHEGYIGCVLVPLFQRAGHEVVGLDNGLFRGCDFDPPILDCKTITLDIRDVEPEHLQGFDAVVHLAGISNDPLGDLNPRGTYDINHEASVKLARAAKAAGVPRFIHSSSCSLYGAAGDAPIDETADFNPVTPYGESKVFVERDVTPMANEGFSPTFLRNSTAYGVSPRLRGDLVVNNLTGYALTTGEVLLKSDGTPWRPLVHIQDISRAFLAVMEADRSLVHGKAYNIGATTENYQMIDVARIVADVVPDSTIRIEEGAGPDKRCYRVDCGLITRELGFECEWTVRKGVEELYEAYKSHGLTLDEFTSSRYVRIRHVRGLIESGQIGTDLRFKKRGAA